MRDGARADDARAAQVDTLFAGWNRPDVPGCGVAISLGGVVVLERGYGAANLEMGTPIGPESSFFVASVSKQFTAMSIALLAKSGRLSVDDEVRRYLPELPDYGHRLTIRHLLTHTGGLRDVFLLRELAAPHTDGPTQNPGLVTLLARQRGLNFTPGSAYQYSNSGYVLLASIVERVSGRSLRAFASANIFTPLGMTRTFFHDDPRQIVPQRASGYSRADDAWRLAATGFVPGSVGNAGLFTTAADLLRWQHNFADPHVGDADLFAAMATPMRLTDGQTSPYGFGLFINTHRGLQALEHGGGDPGYSAYLSRYPAKGLAVAVLCNRDDVDAGGLTRQIAEIYLAGAFEAPAPTSALPVAVSLSKARLRELDGLYRNPATEGVMRLATQDDKVLVSGIPGVGDGFAWTPVTPRRLTLLDTGITLDIEPAGGGRVERLRLTGIGATPQLFIATEPFAPTAAELAAFAGDYASRDELAVTYAVLARDARLVLQIPGRFEIVLEPLFGDAFRAPGLVDVLKFSRDARGRPNAVAVHADGVRALRLTRVTATDRPVR